MRICVAQLNSSVGDLNANLSLIEQVMERAAQEGAQLAVFPEMFLTGYPTKDLLLQKWFAARLQEAVGRVAQISARYGSVGLVLGMPTPAQGGGWCNSAALFAAGKLEHVFPKATLSDDGALGERSYFASGEAGGVVAFAGEKLAVTVGEESLGEEVPGATLVINVSASPFYLGKPETRRAAVQKAWDKNRVPMLFVNRVGGQDELVFDGGSMYVGRDGSVTMFPVFTDSVQVIDTEAPSLNSAEQPGSEAEWIYAAIKRGFRDYMKAAGQSKAVVGLSGGIDSAVVCALAVEVLGPENVRGIIMPGPFSSPGSVTDATALAENLGVQYHVVPITGLYGAYLESLQELLAGREPDITEENIQARIRGNILMAFSNKLGGMVLATSNKSEAAMGYATMYGDMVGGLAPIADIYKTQVYMVAEHINRAEEIIPRASITKAPSAELRPGQKDEDSLPPYRILDPIVRAYVEEGLSISEIVALGYDEETVARVVKTINRMEFKRRQAAPCIRVSRTPFGVVRKVPLAAVYPV